MKGSAPLIADFHLHSRYSYATSPATDLAAMARWAKIKGADLIGTGDFTHPGWLKELETRLEPAGHGTFRYGGVNFFLTAEVSTVFPRGARTYRIHFLLFVPDLGAVRKLRARFSAFGSLSADGRPTLALDCRDLLSMVLDTAPDGMVVPSHAWTPHFGVFGSRSGFDSLEECFGERAADIPAIETGLSSDPAMNRRLSRLDGLTLLSNSDAHSPQNIAREANVFARPGTRDLYSAVRDIIVTGDRERFLFTIEFYPEEGKYHYDGHRSCGVRFSPGEARRHGNRCPVCGKKLTMGVLHRIEDLADRPAGKKPRGAVPFKKVIPLKEILAGVFGRGKQSAAVEKEYLRLVRGFGSELDVLLSAPPGDIEDCAGERIARAVSLMRRGDVTVTPGYDGVYGEVRL